MRDYALEHRRRKLISPEERAARRRVLEERGARLAADGKIHWSDSNEKLAKLGTVSFGIPAGVAEDGFNTCPAKGACAGWCYARQGFYVWPHVAIALERNLEIVRGGYDRFVELAVEDLRERRPKTVRVHDSGDFFEADYLRAWFTIATSLPKIVFYAYTKMHWRFRTMFALGTPKNFRVVQSFGGVDDDRIDLAKPHARVFVDHGDREIAGYVDGTETDEPAIAGVVKIGLVYHSGGKRLSLTQERALRVFPILNDQEISVVNPALPVMFECTPRNVKLTKPRCAEDYYLANGGAVGAEQKAAAAKLDKCKGCSVGRAHREELAGALVEGGRLVGDVVSIAPAVQPTKGSPATLGPSKRERQHAAKEAEAQVRREQIKKENRAVLATAEKSVSTTPPARPAAAPRDPKESAMKKIEPRVCVNPECKKTFTPKHPKARACSPLCGQRYQYLKVKERLGGAPSGRPNKPKANGKPIANGKSPGSAATLVRYLELKKELADFEAAHPGIAEDAERIRELVAGQEA